MPSGFRSSPLLGRLRLGNFFAAPASALEDNFLYFIFDNCLPNVLITLKRIYIQVVSILFIILWKKGYRYVSYRTVPVLNSLYNLRIFNISKNPNWHRTLARRAPPTLWAKATYTFNNYFSVWQCYESVFVLNGSEFQPKI